MGRTFLAGLSLAVVAAATPGAERPPNVVVIFCDDLGYGDLGCYGHPAIRTPHLDRMAAEGMRFTDFYSAAPVCTPSRAALLTGRLPLRSGMTSDTRRVLFPDSAGGLPETEVTLAEVLKERGYATACVGKWHLGHRPQYLPTRHGFDSYFGVPYSNDMDRVPNVSPKGREAFWRAEDRLLERPPDAGRQGDRAARRPAHADEAVHRGGGEVHRGEQGEAVLPVPAHTMAHVPLFASKDYAGKSPRGLYGDVVEELDWSVGEVLKAVRAAGIDKNTWVTFTSDNGPWLTFREHGGSAGLLREGKGSTWEGGMRVPGVMWWPGTIPAGTTNHDIACTMDLFVTAVKLAGGKVPDDRPIDGLRPHRDDDRQGVGAAGRDVLLPGHEALRGPAGAVEGALRDALGVRPGQARVHDPPLIFHLGRDPGEQFDQSKQRPNVIAQIRKLVEEHSAGMRPGGPQLEGRVPKK